MHRTKPELIVFDVNETLLDLSPLKTKVNQVMGSDLAFDLWFSNLLHYSLVETVTGNYADFSSIAAVTFRMVAQKLEIEIDDDKITSTLEAIKSLPPHSDVIPALTGLEKAEFAMVALTNGNQDVAETQLANAKLDGFFKSIISVENVGRYKPHPDPYTFILEKMEISSANAILVAAHGWDIVGAKRAGMQTAFVERKEKSMYALGESPDFTGRTVLEVAEKLVAI